MNAIYKFVMAHLAKRGGKTGLPTIQSGKSLSVELSVKQITQTLEKMGVDVSKITSPKEVEKFLDIQASWLKQTPKKSKSPADVLDLTGKKIDTSKPILGGKNVPEGEGFSMTIAEGPQAGKKITMDEFFDQPLIPLFETTRGCPFACAFCADGQASKNKIHRYDPERTKEELNYIAKRIKNMSELMMPI